MMVLFDSWAFLTPMGIENQEWLHLQQKLLNHDTWLHGFPLILSEQAGYSPGGSWNARLEE